MRKPIGISTLEKAYHFIYEFKNSRDRYLYVQKFTAIELKYIDVLAHEFLSEVNIDNLDLASLLDIVSQIALEDSKWNRDLANTLHIFYRHIELDQKEEGMQILKEFIDVCPSSWYCSLAEIELENFHSSSS
ncbi:hypothetical protein CCP4SC76_4240002 [Gammaproteobacteria bacterium]